MKAERVFSGVSFWLVAGALVTSLGCPSHPGTTDGQDSEVGDASSYVDTGTSNLPVDATSNPPVDASDGSTVTVVERKYRIFQWNIAGGKENDCRSDLITPVVHDFVRDRNIDFVSLNEVCRSQFKAIKEALRKLWGKGTSTRFAAAAYGGRVGNAVFSRLNVDSFYRQDIGDDQYGDRYLLCGKMDSLPHLRFCSTHLSPAASKARNQLDKVLQKIEAWWSNKKDTVLLAGDFNLEPNDTAMNDVYSSAADHPLHNPDNNGSYRELDDDDAEHCLGYGDGTGLRPHLGPCSTGKKIDFIFARQNRIVDGRYFLNVLAIPNTCTGRCSDHHPLVGQVRVRIRKD